MPYKEVHTILDNVKGHGHYVGTYIAWGVNNNGWWVKAKSSFTSMATDWPNDCGTGTEDYF